jgi:hypothetical protein
VLLFQLPSLFIFPLPVFHCLFFIASSFPFIVRLRHANTPAQKWSKEIVITGTLTSPGFI